MWESFFPDNQNQWLYVYVTSVSFSVEREVAVATKTWDKISLPVQFIKCQNSEKWPSQFPVNDLRIAVNHLIVSALPTR